MFKRVSGITLMLLVASVLALAFSTQSASAQIGTIYIRPDGSIDPPTAPIQRNGDVYTLTDNVTSDSTGINIQRGNIILDGAGYTLHGPGDCKGIFLSENGHVAIRNTNIEGFDYGICLYTSFGNSIVGNNITNNHWYGISLELTSDDNIIDGNNITVNGGGIYLSESSNNDFYRNNIANNGNGIYLSESSNNRFYHNNFIDNIQQVYFYVSGYANFWDDGYPSGGNHWSDYSGADVQSGPLQNQPGKDGIGDTPYIIDANNTDRYPLMNRPSADTTPPNMTDISQIPKRTDVTPADEVRVNATVTDATSGVKKVVLKYAANNTSFVSVNMTNLAGNIYNATIPALPLGTNVTYVIMAEDMNNNTITTEQLGFTYQYQVVPEFPSFLILATFMIVTLVLVIAHKKVRARTHPRTI